MVHIIISCVTHSVKSKVRVGSCEQFSHIHKNVNTSVDFKVLNNYIKILNNYNFKTILRDQGEGKCMCALG